MAHGQESGSARRRDVAVSLRQVRTEAGRTEQDAAAHLDCSPSRLARIEAGTATVRAAEVRALLDFYGVTGPQRKQLLQEAREAGARCWWYPYADLIDETFETQLILEDEAAVLRTYQQNLVPGLLQTERYAWELIGTRSDLPLESVQRQARLRTLRQRMLNREDTPRLAVILDEAVLRRPVGNPAVMCEQYGRLATVANTSTVTIQILPFQAGPHHAMGLGFHIFEFAGDPRRVVELELLDRVRFVAEPAEVAHYADAFDQASHRALDAAQSMALLEELAATP